jgi:hypothetical protein
MLRLRTAKRAAGSPMPLEGKALAVALTTAKPAPMKEEPTLQRSLESRTPEKGGVRAPPRGLPDTLEPIPLP